MGYQIMARIRPPESLHVCYQRGIIVQLLRKSEALKTYVSETVDHRIGMRF